MYLWNIEALKNELAGGHLSQGERFKYYLATVILYSLALEISFIFPASFSNLEIAQSVSTFAITIAGTVYCYLLNRSGDDREFIDRMFCIGWVVGIRLLVLWTATYIVYLIGGNVVGGDEFSSFSESFNPVDLAFALVLCILAYWLIGTHIRDVARRPQFSQKC